MTLGSTRQLASARLELVCDSRNRTLLRAVLLAVLVAAGLTAGLRVIADGAAASGVHRQLQQENSALRAELARLETELRLEHATRAALEQQVADLEREAVERERQLAFVNAQRDCGRAAAR